jgi:outer membrane receptor protein involved in Fe transport
VKKKLLFLILLPLCAISLHAQKTFILKGLVTDNTSKERVIGATVYDINDITAGVVTDVNGNYELHLTPGKHTVVCSLISMAPDTAIINTDTNTVLIHNFSLHEQMTQMQTLVISAGRYEQKLEDITVSMDVLKPSLIENKNSTNIKQALDQAPGLNILDGEAQIRGGSGFDFGIGSRVAILIDGLPALPGDGGRIDWNFFPLENVEQIEIIKGASSVTNGSSALDGSINIRTAYPTDIPSTSVSVYSGIYDAPPVGEKWWNGAANFSGTSFLHTEKLGQLDLVLGGMVLYDHGYIGPPSYLPLLGKKGNDTTVSPNSLGEKTGRFNFGLRYHPKNAPRLNFGLNGNFVESHNVLSLIWENADSGLYRAYPNTIILQDQKIFYLDPFISFLSAGGFEHSLRARFYYTNNVITDNPSNNTTEFYAEYQCIKKFYALGGLNVTGGLVLNQTHSNTDSTSYLGVSLPATANYLQNYAAYAQLDKKFWDVLNLSVGFRDENFIINNGKVDSKPVFRSGASFKLAQATFLRCSYGQGYRYPSLTERYINSQFSDLSIFANPGLQPETSWNSEIGIKQGFKIGDFMGFIDAAAFWQQYQNTIELIYGQWGKQYITPTIFSYTPGFEYLNTGPTQVKGIDASLEGEGKITKDLKIDVLGGYTYTLPQAMDPSLIFATDTSKTKLSYNSTSSNTANNILKYRFQNIAKIDIEVKYKACFAGGDWVYYSHMQNIDEAFYSLSSTADYGIAEYRNAHTGGINVFNARIGKDFSKKLKASLVVNNVLNLSYSLRPLKIEPPRTFAVRVTWKV